MELFKILGTVAIDNQGANKALNETVGIAEGAHSKISAAFDKIGAAAVKVGKVVATGLAAGATATGVLLKNAVDAYADYEQLVGGVETLFKESADKVMNYADNAFKSAGLSANEYMDTVTSFSASLLQSLGGDTKAAADKADMAITDMADNANKMGTSMSMIQNAYQGFAKQNYTMLDNLKLGYGGTNEEMFRLMTRAAELDSTFADNAVFSLNEKGQLQAEFADIVDAIHIVQTEMGITGTTAKEASSTITGSLASAKSAWKNLLTGIADDEADFEGLIDNFVETVTIAGENVIERVEIALEGSAKLIDKLFPIIAEKIPKIINDILPDVLRSAVSIVQNLVNGINENKDTIMKTAFDAVMVIIHTITETLPQILNLGADLLLTFLNGIVENLDALADSALDMVLSIAEGIVDYLPRLTEASIELIKKLVALLTDEKNLDRLLDAALEIILALAEAIVEVLPALLDAAVEILVKLATYLTDPENLLKIIETGIKLVGAIVKGLLNSVGSLAEGAGELISTIVDTIFETDWLQVGKDIISAIADGLILGLEDLVNFFKDHEGLTSAMFDFCTSMGVMSGNTKSTKKDNKGFIGIGADGKATIGMGNTNSSWLDIYNLPSHAEGLDFVPYDGYIAELHKGEMVVPAKESNFLRSGSMGVVDDTKAQKIVDLLETLIEVLPEAMKDAFASMKFDVNKREFARLVKVVE